MQSILYERFGEPEDVLRVSDIPLPEPGPGEVRVRMLMSPVNPSDFNMIRGTYNEAMRKLPWNLGKPDERMSADRQGARPAIALPYTPGGDGVGVVEKTGSGFLAKRLLGKRVVVIPAKKGNWQEFNVVPAKQAIPIGEEIPLEQAAAFFINPVTAYVMTREVLRVPRGAWLMQTAAGSQVGRMVIRLGKKFGFKTLNVVRRSEQRDVLLNLGADAVIATDTLDPAEEIAKLTDGHGVPFALDCVGGELLSRILTCLAPRGRLMTYGTLSGEPVRFSPRDLMTPMSSIEGFFLPQWMLAQNLVKKIQVIGAVKRLVRAGILVSDVGKIFPLSQVKEAVLAAKSGAGGKVFLRIGSE